MIGPWRITCTTPLCVGDVQFVADDPERMESAVGARSGATSAGCTAVSRRVARDRDHLITSAFGPGVAVLYMVFGLVVAIAGGALIQRLGMDDQVMDFVRGESADVEEDMSRTPRERVLYAAGETASTFRKVFPYILVGVGIGSIVHNWIPQGVIEPVLGDGNPFAVILATVAGAPIYADVFGVIPIAESLLAKGAALGTVLSFMMSVTVLSVPSLIMLARVVKPKLLGIFVGICLIGIVACGYTFNVLQPFL